MPELKHVLLHVSNVEFYINDVEFYCWLQEHAIYQCKPEPKRQTQD